MMTVFGLWDLDGNGWLGSTEKPWTHEDRDLARIAREVFAKRLGWSPLRIEVRAFDGDANVPVDLGKPLMSVRRALRELEAR
jgi:hypothetical protein